MTRRGPEALGLAVGLVAALAALVLLTGATTRSDLATQRLGAQQAVGGLGFGPATRLVGGGEFDPRVARSRAPGPIPASAPSFPLPPPSLLSAP